jgi:glycosyltransferase involved in cell wall biosynthesis
MTGGWPSVGVVLPTYDRPVQLRAALGAVLGQDYPGLIQVVVVHDRSEPDQGLANGERVRVLANGRTAGLAGARNTGVLALNTELVAFCDDDDEWLAGKLRRQVAALRAVPGAEFASCGIVVQYRGRSNPRLAGRGQVTHTDLLRSRMTMVHSSTYLADRVALMDGIGLLDEQIPGGQNEDWDLALRAARRRPIVHVDAPLVRVTWGESSYFSRQWESKVAALQWMLERHPDIGRCRPGAARVYGQIAFAYACLGRRAEAARWAARALGKNWHERRIPFAMAVAAGLVSGDQVLRLLHARGHGI